MIFTAAKHQACKYRRGPTPHVKILIPPVRSELDYFACFLYFIASETLLDIMHVQPLRVGDLDYSCILTSNQYFSLVLVSVKKKRVDGARRRNLRQGIQCKVAAVAS